MESALKKLLFLGLLLLPFKAQAIDRKYLTTFYNGYTTKLDYVNKNDTDTVVNALEVCFPDGSCQSSAAGSPISSGTIISSNQYSAAYFSAVGSSNVIAGLSPGTSGQVLVTGGSTGPPFWGTRGTITGVTAGTNLTGGGTSGVVTLNVNPNASFTSITWPDGTVQVSSPTAGGGGTGGGVGSNCTLLNDTGGTLWAACVDTTGHLTTTSLGASPITIAPIVLVDSGGTAWDVTIRTTGNLETELH